MAVKQRLAAQREGPGMRNAWALTDAQRRIEAEAMRRYHAQPAPKDHTRLWRQLVMVQKGIIACLVVAVLVLLFR